MYNDFKKKCISWGFMKADLMAGKSISLYINAMSFIRNWVDSSISHQLIKLFCVINLQKRSYETYI